MAKSKRRKRVLASDGTESDLERSFLVYWNSQYPNAPPVTQHKFHPTAKYEFDFAWPTCKLAVEVQGYGPGHFSVPGMTQDCLKGVAALKLGWRIVYLTSTLLLPENIGAITSSIAMILGIPPKSTSTYIPLSKR